MESAPVTMPATIEVIFAAAFVPASPAASGSRTGASWAPVRQQGHEWNFHVVRLLICAGNGID